MDDGAFPRRVVLAGAGHAHVQLLHGWASEGAPGGVELTVAVDREDALYSGMVPGLVSGRYRREELTIHAAPLVEAAGGRLVVEPLASVDPAGRRLVLEDGTALDYDVASLNLGSAVAGREVPGVREHAVGTRPLARLLEAVERVGRDGAPRAAAVVGGGAAGCELAAALASVLDDDAEVAVIEAGGRLLSGRAPAVGRRLQAELARRGVRVLTGVAVEAVERERVRLADGTALESGLTLWAAGADPPDPLAASRLPLDDAGFVRVRPTLQVVGHPDLFAVGDCAALEGHDLPRAGVHAVRQGPVLRSNLEAWLTGAPLRSWQPQSDFLVLLDLGDGRALGTKWGVVTVGRWVMWLKERIDRRFVERFRM